MLPTLTQVHRLPLDEAHGDGGDPGLGGRRFTALNGQAALCHHWWQLAERPPKEAKAGVLSRLKNGERSE